MKIWGLTAADVSILRKVVAAFRRAGGIFPPPPPRRPSATPLPYGTLFAVRLWQDGGTTDGDEATQCDRTYTAKELDAVEGDDTALVYGTELTPVQGRPLTGQLDCPATTGEGIVGVGFFDQTGEFQLWSANERLHTTAC